MRLHVNRAIRTDSEDPFTDAIPLHVEPTGPELGKPPEIITTLQHSSQDEGASGFRQNGRRRKDWKIDEASRVAVRWELDVRG
jgi:hypothetical protein